MWASIPEPPPRQAPRREILKPVPSAGFQSVAEIAPSVTVSNLPGSLLPPSATEISVSKRTLKRVETVCLIREQRESGRQELAFNARPFVLCGIPLRRPPRDRLTYTRHNGKLFLNIAAHPDFGLSFGQDRLISIWIATPALQQKSRIVRFETASEMLSFFGLQLDGFHYRRIVEGFKRIFAATVFFGTEDHPSGRNLIDWHRFYFLDHMKLWFNPGEQNRDEQCEENVIALSEAFYGEIDQHRIPVEREIARSSFCTCTRARSPRSLRVAGVEELGGKRPARPNSDRRSRRIERAAWCC